MVAAARAAELHFFCWKLLTASLTEHHTAGHRSRMARPGNACPGNFFDGVYVGSTPAYHLTADGHTLRGKPRRGEAWHL